MSERPRRSFCGRLLPAAHHRHNDGFGSKRVDLHEQALQPVLTTGGKHKPSAFARQGEGGRPADSGAGTGYYSYFPNQFLRHEILLIRLCLSLTNPSSPSLFAINLPVNVSRNRPQFMARVASLLAHWKDLLTVPQERRGS
jgi:hypothetical protein